MRLPSSKASRPHHIVCPFCESGELIPVGPGSARCRSCGLQLVGSTLETLRDVIGLPDTLGTHACDCGLPEMRELPGVRFGGPSHGNSFGRRNARLTGSGRDGRSL